MLWASSVGRNDKVADIVLTKHDRGDAGQACTTMPVTSIMLTDTTIVTSPGGEHDEARDVDRPHAHHDPDDPRRRVGRPVTPIAPRTPRSRPSAAANTARPS